MATSAWTYGSRFIRRRVGNGIADVGRVTLMVGDMARTISDRLPATRLIVDQMNAIGVGSLGLVIVVSLFTGAVAAVQAAYQFENVVPLKYIGAVILRSVIIELG